MADPNLNINELTHNLVSATSQVKWIAWSEALICLVVGVLLAGFVSAVAGRVLKAHTSAHYTQIVRRILYYGIIIIFFLFALSMLQLNMQVLGIATLITVALGFASQTAMSNIVTGLFLVFERPFSIGDKLEYNGITGELLAIDLLSIKILTDQNTLVRIPNEMLLKNQFTNLTKFPTRRLETSFYVSMDEDLTKVREVLLEVARKNPMAIDMPPPKLLFQSFDNGAMYFLFAVWVKTEDFYTLKHILPCEMQAAFVANEIKMPIQTIRLDNNVE